MPSPSTKLLALSLTTMLMLAGSSSMAASSANVVRVTLWDTGMEHMGIKADRNTVSAGPVTFQVTNESKDLVHEMVLVRSPKAGSSMPYDPKSETVQEEDLQDLGEIADLDPGKTGEMTVTLDPGDYLLICNEPAHYEHGMHTMLRAQ